MAGHVASPMRSALLAAALVGAAGAVPPERRGVEVEIDPDTLVPDFVLRRLQTKTATDLFEAVRRRVAARRE